MAVRTLNCTMLFGCKVRINKTDLKYLTKRDINTDWSWSPGKVKNVLLYNVERGSGFHLTFSPKGTVGPLTSLCIPFL
jgi:hypothetical protein